MVADPTRPVSSIDVLDGAELARLDQWSNRATLTQAAHTPVSIPALFAAQAQRVPEAVALTWGERSWTYRELDEITNRFTHLLADNGIGPGQRVALLLPRSAEAIMAILAVLKTGAAYVPIDPAAPQARMKLILDDAAPTVAITNPELAERLAEQDLRIIDAQDIHADAGHPGTA
ncbi:hypothetical protein C6A85_80595, partial [Mycobacterium sp. ITM-2017-0098]